MANNTCRIPRKIVISLAVDNLFKALNQDVRVTTPDYLFSQNSGCIWKLVVSPRRNRIYSLTYIKKIKLCTRKWFSIGRIHFHTTFLVLTQPDGRANTSIKYQLSFLNRNPTLRFWTCIVCAWSYNPVIFTLFVNMSSPPSQSTHNKDWCK